MSKFVKWMPLVLLYSLLHVFVLYTLSMVNWLHIWWPQAVGVGKFGDLSATGWDREPVARSPQLWPRHTWRCRRGDTWPARAAQSSFRLGLPRGHAPFNYARFLTTPHSLSPDYVILLPQEHLQILLAFFLRGYEIKFGSTINKGVPTNLQHKSKSL